MARFNLYHLLLDGYLANKLLRFFCLQRFEESQLGQLVAHTMKVILAQIPCIDYCLLGNPFFFFHHQMLVASFIRMGKIGTQPFLFFFSNFDQPTNQPYHNYIYLVSMRSVVYVIIINSALICILCRLGKSGSST